MVWGQASLNTRLGPDSAMHRTWLRDSGFLDMPSAVRSSMVCAPVSSSACSHGVGTRKVLSSCFHKKFSAVLRMQNFVLF